jgi:hypothetical protein
MRPPAGKERTTTKTTKSFGETTNRTVLCRANSRNSIGLERQFTRWKAAASAKYAANSVTDEGPTSASRGRCRLSFSRVLDLVTVGVTARHLGRT